MIDFCNITKEEVSKIKYVLTDIDGTLTNGRIVPKAFEALWKLHDAGYIVIPVTGRTAGWAAVNILDWPVDAIIAESGSVVFYLENDRRKQFMHPSVPENNLELQSKIYEAVKEKFPNIRVSIDQFSRLNDFAFNYAEEPKEAMSMEDAEEILKTVLDMGGKGTISSVHVNTWFGDYDKLPMALLYLKEHYGEENARDKVIYFGDAMNDEKMFKYFPMACGVANIAKYAPNMKYLPKYVTAEEGGLGFASAVDLILSMK